MKKTLTSCLSLAMAMLLMVNTTIHAQSRKGKNELNGVWQCVELTNLATGQITQHPRNYYKFISDSVFLLIDIANYVDTVKAMVFTGKFGTCERTSDSILVEGYDPVVTYLKGGNMMVEYPSGGTTIMETWKKCVPSVQVKRIAEVFANKTGNQNPYNGIWKAKSVGEDKSGFTLQTMIRQDVYSRINDECYARLIITGDVKGAVAFNSFVSIIKCNTDSTCVIGNAPTGKLVLSDDKNSLSETQQGPDGSFVVTHARSEFPSVFKKAIKIVR